VFSTAGFVFISFGGLIKVASIAEEVKTPARIVPLGMVLSLVTVGILYALVVYVTCGVLGAAQLDHSLTPISDGAAVIMGEWGRIALSVAAILAFISTANAGIMSASRYPLALSRDRLLPDMFGRINPRFKTPAIAILATGLLIVFAVFLDLDILVKTASTVLIFTFMFSCLCVIIMRESGVQNYRPRFRTPLYPWVQVAGIAGSWLMVVNMGKEALLTGSVLFACGFAVYWLFGRARAKKDFALLHLIEKVAARELVDVSLEEELKEIIRERDDITKDRFDKIIEDSVVLDIDGSMPADVFFKLAAGKMSARLGADASDIQALLAKREKESSTILSPGLAIPHIIVDGTHTFIILLARCRKGITFPGKKQSVRMVFVIAGTRDERNFHLRALSAIAQIVQDPHFEKRWMTAKNEEALRDIVLLGERKRHD
ncbi:MAG: amino acid permease, partial [Candidatus Omnitrophica bacterium]|nr:amino acid permease [Candidatus Omnitrophota bacterium]